MQTALQRWLMNSLVPDAISRPVLGYLTQFAAKASGLGAVGFSFLMVTALMLILTIDRTLNNIWRVRRLRPLGQRVLIYWAAITLGPLVLGGSLALTAAVAGSVSRNLGATLPGGARLLFNAIQFFVLAAGMTALYRYVPNTHVRWRHAWAGGVFVSASMEVAKKALSMYLASVPTYSMIYGAFATLPILLLWIYVAWVIVLLGAVVAAYLPSLLAGVARPANVQGWTFLLAVETLQQLHAARAAPGHGLTAAQLAARLRVDELQLEPVLEALIGLDWVVQVNEAALSAANTADTADPRYVLLAAPAATPMQPLVRRLLLERSQALERFWGNTGMEALRLADVLPREVSK
jgi:membrane protein